MQVVLYNDHKMVVTVVVVWCMHHNIFKTVFKKSASGESNMAHGHQIDLFDNH